MKKKKLSLNDKQIVRSIISYFLIQIFIILLFICVMDSSKSIDIADTKQISFVIQDIYYIRYGKSPTLVVCSNSDQFVFLSRATSADYSTSQIYDIVSVGDQIMITYVEARSLFGKYNEVVDARTITETIRSLEQYNIGMTGGANITKIVFIIELVFYLF